MLSHKYEFADSAEALLSDLSLPNGTLISPAATALVVPRGCVFDTVGDAGGEADDVELVGDRGRNVDFCWLGEAMLGFLDVLRKRVAEVGIVDEDEIVGGLIETGSFGYWLVMLNVYQKLCVVNGSTTLAWG